MPRHCASTGGQLKHRDHTHHTWSHYWQVRNRKDHLRDSAEKPRRFAPAQRFANRSVSTGAAANSHKSNNHGLQRPAAATAAATEPATACAGGLWHAAGGAKERLIRRRRSLLGERPRWGRRGVSQGGLALSITSASRSTAGLQLLFSPLTHCLFATHPRLSSIRHLAVPTAAVGPVRAQFGPGAAAHSRHGGVCARGRRRQRALCCVW
jgi:hypothetical protein